MDLTRTFRAVEACEIVGISYKECDYWDRTDLVVPSVAGGEGSGNYRHYSVEDLVCLAAVKRLTNAGFAPRGARPFVERIREANGTRLRVVTLNYRDLDVTLYLGAIEKDLKKTLEAREKTTVSV